MKLRYLVVITLTAAGAMFAQEFRGAISGAVTDATGAAIAGAKVTATETRTNTKIETVSEGTGQYTTPFLLPGDYDVSVNMAGFKEFVRKGIHVGAGERPRIDIRLDVGDAAQSVEVTAEAPLVNNENASVGHAITTKEVEDLPLNGGSPWMLAQLEIGVIYSPFNSNSSVQQTYDSSNNFSIAGTPTQSSEMLLNGAPNATWDLRSAFTPPKDAVQEVRTTVLNTDASFGHTRGGTINMVMKSGTNELHGSLWENMQPSNLTANSFFNNAKGLGNPLTHYNQYGLTAGGPVYLPKVWNGKDKLFWFFAWQHDKNTQPFTTFISVPTDAEKAGDFSQVLRTDGTQLYDPFSATQNGSAISRQPLPGNIIPTSRINPITQKYLKFFPQPNVAGVNATSRADGYFNYGTTAPNSNTADNESGQLDYNMSNRSRMSFNVRHNTLAAKKNDYFQSIASGQITSRENWGGSLDEVFTLSPTSILNLRLNYTYMYESATDSSEGFDASTLGFPSYITENTVRPALPYVYFDTSTAFQSLGFNQAAKRPSQSIQLYVSWTKLKGNHSFKLGSDVRQMRLGTITYGYASGGYNFGGNRWVNQNASASATEAMGQDMAQFLYGLPTQGFFDINTYGSWYNYFASGFIQDDWRVKRNLTVNLGLRFDYDGPVAEKYGRTENGWAFNTPNPIAGAAIAAYNQKPIPQIPVGSFQVPGGLTYPNGKGAAYENTSHLLSPRVGLAWSPDALHGKTVIRTGFGLFAAPTVISYLAQNGNYSSNPIIDQEGFSQETVMTPSTNNYVSPSATFSDPFPGGIVQPNAKAVGQTTFLGNNISFLNPQAKSPYSLRWNFGFQHSLSANMVLEAVYIGNHSVHTPINLTQINGIPRQYLSTLPVRDTPLINALNASVPNPFNGLVPSGTPAGSTTSVAQLLSKYPEFPLGYTNGGFSGSGGVLEQNLNVGSSYFHSLNIRVQRRLSRGVTLIGNYVFSKLMDQTTWLNDTDPRPEKRIGVFDHTHRGVITLTYELPVGKGRPIAIQSRWLNRFIGGWQLNAIYVKQSGQPFTWMGTSSTTIGDLVYFGEKLKFNARETNGLAFNTSAFDTRTATQFAYHIRTFSTTFSSLRGDGTNELNASMLKKVEFSDSGKRYFQLRFETFNLFNHPSFAFPQLAPTNSAFGLVTAQSNRSRSIQLTGRIVF
jgi:Carboxypeptidase regulatory-like domain